MADAICAPAEGDEALWQAVAALRTDGETVIHSLSGETDPRCSRALRLSDGKWGVEDL